MRELNQEELDELDGFQSIIAELVGVTGSQLNDDEEHKICVIFKSPICPVSFVVPLDEKGARELIFMLKQTIEVLSSSVS